jgi:processive 1,2-diacylglycerol beta-glucosyltransferase
MKKDMYKILNVMGDVSSCAFYRSHLPAINLRDELKECGIQLDTALHLDPKKVDEYDCYLFARIPNSDAFPHIDLTARKGKRIIWDIDDELWNIPDSNPASQSYTPGKLMFLNYYFNMSSSITVSTPNLARSLSDTWGINISRLYILENLIDTTVYHNEEQSHNGPIRILWSGSEAHAGDFDPIDALWDRYKDDDNVRFILYGYMPERFKTIESQKLTHIQTSNRKYYESIVSLIQPDIALMPLDDHPFNKCKSAIKYYEMSMCSAACIASNMSPYADVISHNTDGILCDNVDDWVSNCDYLIGNDITRDRLVQSAQRKIVSKYSWNSNCTRFNDWLNFFKLIPNMK